MRGLAAAVLVAAGSLVSANGALAGGGHYVFDGGTQGEQAQVRAALDASSFDWSLVPVTVTIRIGVGLGSSATPGQITLDADLLDAGAYAWGIVQHEYAHEVDFFLLGASARAQLLAALGGTAWWQRSSPAFAPDGTLQHGLLASERFASTLAWSYWQSPANALRPHSRADESGAMAPAAFRRLLTSLLARPSTPAEPA